MDIWAQRERFKDAVKEYRETQGKLLREVAELIGIKEQTLKDYLYRDNVKPSLEVLQRAASLFGVSVLEFLDSPEPGELKTAPQLDERARFMRRVMSSDLADLPETEREAAFAAWKAIVAGFTARR